jgi:hypothetical protein
MKVLIEAGLVFESHERNRSSLRRDRKPKPNRNVRSRPLDPHDVQVL